MERYSLKEAQEHLEQLIKDAQNGKTVLIVGVHKEAVQLVPVAPAEPDVQPRKPGSAKGLIYIAPDFDDPLDDFAEYME